MIFVKKKKKRSNPQHMLACCISGHSFRFYILQEMAFTFYVRPVSQRRATVPIKTGGTWEDVDVGCQHILTLSGLSKIG